MVLIWTWFVNVKQNAQEWACPTRWPGLLGGACIGAPHVFATQVCETSVASCAITSYPDWSWCFGLFRSKEVDWQPYFTTRLVDDFATHLRVFRKAQERLNEREDPKQRESVLPAALLPGKILICVHRNDSHWSLQCKCCVFGAGFHLEQIVYRWAARSRFKVWELGWFSEISTEARDTKRRESGTDGQRGKWDGRKVSV